jgi:hypothetical protein
MRDLRDYLWGLFLFVFNSIKTLKKTIKNLAVAKTATGKPIFKASDGD